MFSKTVAPNKNCAMAIGNFTRAMLIHFMSFESVFSCEQRFAVWDIARVLLLGVVGSLQMSFKRVAPDEVFVAGVTVMGRA